MPARLIVYPADGPVAELPLSEASEHLVGRDPACTVHLDDDRVSRRHARLTPLGDGRWQLTDLGSKNGVSVDGRPVSAVEISAPAWIAFGGVHARFEPTAEPTAAADLAEELRRRRASADLQRSLDPGEGLEPLLRRVLRSVLTVAGAERGFVVLARPGGELDLAATVGLAAEEIEGRAFSGSVGAVERAIAEVRPIVLSDVAADTQFGARPSVVTGGIRALVCLPLAVLGRVLGAVYADSREPGRTFTRLDVEILEGFASHAALALAVARLHREVAGLGDELPTSTRLGVFDPSRRGAAVPETRTGQAWSELTAAHRGEPPADDMVGAPARPDSETSVPDEGTRG